MAGSESAATRGASPFENDTTTWAFVTGLAQSSSTRKASGVGHPATVENPPGCAVWAIPSLDGVHTVVARLRSPSPAGFAPAGNTTKSTATALMVGDVNAVGGGTVGVTAMSTSP